MDARTLVEIGTGASVTASGSLFIVSMQNPVKTNATAETAIAGGLTGSLTSIADNQLDANSNITTGTGSVLRANYLYVEAQTNAFYEDYVREADTDADTVVEWVLEKVGTACEWVVKILTFGILSGKKVCHDIFKWVAHFLNSDQNAIHRGHDNRNSLIDFNSNVILSGQRAELTVREEDGGYVVERSPESLGFDFQGTPIDLISVHDMAFDPYGKGAVITSPGYLKGHVHFTFEDSVQVHITNHTDLDLELNDIDIWSEQSPTNLLHIAVCEDHWDVDGDSVADFTYDTETSLGHGVIEILNNLRI